MSALPIFFISHGGGPWPYIPEMKAEFQKTADWLIGLPGKRAFVDKVTSITMASYRFGS